MLDIKFIRENPELVKENIRKKFKDHKLPLVDEVIELDAKKREVNTRANELRATRNKVSKEIGALMGQGKREEAEEKKQLVSRQAEELAELERLEAELAAALTERMMKIPNIIDPSVPIGKSDEENVQVEVYGETGDVFNPNLHNAVMHIESEELGENTIAQVFQKGFKTGEKVIRFAMVQVAN